MSSRTTRRFAVTVAALAALFASAPPIAAETGPSIWARARYPEIDERLQVLRRAEALMLKYRALQRRRRDEREVAMGTLYLRDARKVLEEGGAASSRDATLRHRLAEVRFELHDYAGAAALYESIVRAQTPAPMRESAFTDLAICYARLDRHDEEIHAYSEALALQSHPSRRATLLANRAEAYMFKGNLTAAIEGYRAALALLSPMDLLRFGATTLWGLGVALDRSGDLDGGIEAILLARTYDPQDKQLAAGSWFYVPEHDAHWYKALGFWTAARRASLGAVRAEAIGRAVTAWQDYIASAPAADPWLPLAKARLKACEKERDLARKKARSPRKPAGGSPDALDAAEENAP